MLYRPCRDHDTAGGGVPARTAPPPLPATVRSSDGDDPADLQGWKEPRGGCEIPAAGRNGGMVPGRVVYDERGAGPGPARLRRRRAAASEAFGRSTSPWCWLTKSPPGTGGEPLAKGSAPPARVDRTRADGGRPTRPRWPSGRCTSALPDGRSARAGAPHRTLHSARLPTPAGRHVPGPVPTADCRGSAVRELHLPAVVLLARPSDGECADGEDRPNDEGLHGEGPGEVLGLAVRQMHDLK
jgi:hypothetical protein